MDKDGAFFLCFFLLTIYNAVLYCLGALKNVSIRTIRHLTKEGRVRGTKTQQSDYAPGRCSDHFGALVSQTSRVIRRSMDARIAAEVTPELTGVRGMLLGEIVRANKEKRDVYQRDVERWMQLRRSSVTAVLQAMEQDGFITRCSVAQDARLKRLTATPKGVAYHERIRLSIDNFERDLQRGVQPEQQAVARAVLERILSNAQSVMGEG